MRSCACAFFNRINSTLTGITSERSNHDDDSDDNLMDDYDDMGDSLDSRHIFGD